jgi:hypothetical protein
MHNLLPRETRLTLKRRYQERVVTVALLIGSVAVLLASVSLAPSLLAVFYEIENHSAQAEKLGTVLAEDAGGEASRAALKRGANIVALLKYQQDKDLYSSILEDLLTQRDDNITITSAQ